MIWLRMNSRSARLTKNAGFSSVTACAGAAVTAPPAPETSRTAQVRSATRRKLAGEPTPREEKAAGKRAGKGGAGKGADKTTKSKKTAPTRKASS